MLTCGPPPHRDLGRARLFTGALSGAELAPSLNWNGLYIGPRIETQAGNWSREREYIALCFSFEPRIKDSWLWTVQKAKDQARILRSIKNENKNTSTLFLLWRSLLSAPRLRVFGDQGNEEWTFCRMLIFWSPSARPRVTGKAPGPPQPCISSNSIQLQSANCF